MTHTHFSTMILLSVALAAPAIPTVERATTTQTPAPGAKPAVTQPTKPPTAPPGKRGTTPAKPPVARGRGAAPMSAAAKAKLRNPSALKDVAPAEYRAAFDTSAGPFVILVHRSWAPKGADRFYNLVKYGFFDNTRFFRVLPNFMVQFGLNGDPAIQGPWRDANITDDPVTQSNRRGKITFATAGPNSRTTQVFINFGDNAMLDGQGFAPFGEVISGMESVDKITAEYREQPDQGRIQAQGNAYLTQSFPRLDYVRTAKIVAAPAKPKS